MMPMGNLETRRIDSGEHSEPFDLELKDCNQQHDNLSI